MMVYISGWWGLWYPILLGDNNTHLESGPWHLGVLFSIMDRWREVEQGFRGQWSLLSCGRECAVSG